MSKIIINWKKTSPALRKGLNLLKDVLPLDFSDKGKGVNVKFKEGQNGLIIKKEKDHIVVNFSSKNQAFRALGIINGKLRAGKPIQNIHEKQYFDLINIMMDVSRNAAMKKENLKELFKYFALMGINSFMLYTECNYEVPGEPFWGYNLGTYTIKELKELDSFADDLGIEMFPCIQTLGHLKRVLQWETYRDIADTRAILLVGVKRVYELIDRIISAASKPYKSRRIHIGMDEAWELGMGNYFRKHGYTERFSIMKQHLKEVLKITNRYGLKPMIWSDMFCEAASSVSDRYDENMKFTKEIKESIPPDVDLVYWDYYHLDKDSYKLLLKKHFEICPSPIMGTGAQTWNRFWTHYPYAFDTIHPSLMACKEIGIKQVIMTVWGDDGCECDYYSFLPAMQYYAEHSFNKRVDEEKWQENLLGSCNIKFQDWEPAGRLDFPEGIIKAGYKTNPAKFLLWEDPVFGLFQPLIQSYHFRRHYTTIAGQLARVLKNGKGLDKRLELPYQLAKVLTVKCDLPSRIYNAYKAKNKNKLSYIAVKELPALKSDILKLWRIHKNMWLSTYKVQGWEVLETRYGALVLRLETLKERLQDYVSGKIKVIEELESKRLKIVQLKKGILPSANYRYCCSSTLLPVN